MKIAWLLPALTLATASLEERQVAGTNIRDMHIVRDGPTLYLNGTRWRAVGANVYWLGLDENVRPPAGEPFYEPLNASYPTKGRVTEIMEILVGMGATMIRSHTLGANIGNPLSIMPEEGKINEAAFDTIDWAVYQARKYGIRLMVPLVDNYDYYHGGKFNFLRWAGFNLTQRLDSSDPQVMEFYNNPKIIASFKFFVDKLLTHVNKYTNMTYAQDPTIFAIESGNELLGPNWGDMNCPVGWVQDIARHVKSLAPQKLFVDGTYGVNASHLSVPEIDIFSDHFYGVDTTQLQSDLSMVASVNKTFFAGEYDWIGFPEESTAAGNNLSDWFRIIENSPIAIGDAFWSLFGRNAPNCSEWVDHGDGLAMRYGYPGNSDFKTSKMKMIRKHFMKMSQGATISANESLPVVPCPSLELCRFD